MVCELCGDHEATVHLTQAVNDQVREVHLCPACAAKSGLNIQNSMALADILLGVGAQKASDTRAVGDKSCQRCQMRFADFKKTSRLGCPACYDAFAAELETLLDSMHRSRQHAGKVPSRAAARPGRPAPPVAALKQALDAAIGAEDYEEAARLRDRIRRESEPGTAGGSAP
jgi:protein arginine kinase activator